MNKSTVLTLSISVIFFGGLALLAGCGTNQNSSVNSTANTDHSAMNHAQAPTDVDKAFRIEFSSDPGQPQANQPTTLSFTVKDGRGTVVKDLPIVHEKPMHLLVVSRDLSEFYHVHPDVAADGSYKVVHTFPNGGEYKMYADFTPKDSAQVVEVIDIKVGGPERAKVNLVPDSKFEKTVDGLKIVMRPSSAIEAGQELTLDFQAFDAASGKPATDLQNYLGELAHFVIISEDLEDFVHAHPMAKGEKMDGMKMDADKAEDHSAGGHSHGNDSKMPGTPSASEVSAHTAFPRSGLYKLWAQFQRGGNVISVPFIVKVAEGEAKPVKAANIPAGATQVTVSSKGYEPSSISVKKGQPVKLAFYRADGDNCGGEVVFAKQNIRKKLAVGDTVLIEFTPTEPGEIAFACGMDMLRGKLVVSE